MLSELDLFGVPPTQLSVERGYETEHRPLSQLSPTSPIEFVITSSHDEYILFSESYLILKFQLTNIMKNPSDNEPGDVWSSIYFTQNLLGSMFESCKLVIGNKEITFSSGNYAWRSYLESLLGYSHEAKFSHLSCGGFFNAQSAEKFKISFTPGIGDDRTKSKTITLLGKLNLDLTFQDRALIGGADLRIHLMPNDPKFYVKSSRNLSFDVNFLSCSFMAYRLKATPEMANAHNKALMVAPIKYPITRTEVKSICISSGISDVNLDNIVIGQLPRRVIIGMVKRDIFSPTSVNDDDSFKFENFGVKYLSLNADGIQYPSKPYTPNFDTNDYIREYYGLFQALNQNGTYGTITLDRFEYKDDKTLFGFNLTPDLSSGGHHLNPIKHGALNLSLKFGRPLEQPITVIALCEFDNLIQIAADRSVATDYI
ncbi:uncharacterized protein F54H12.2-like [Brevipalpus obovatus]|uniref:uncharacterized protein F54H12.2-like n=1 Tax=Brevipalpus obovatus TaxID=246614 RepID=UPI003D9E91F7